MLPLWAVCPHWDPTHLCRSGRRRAVSVPADQELEQYGDTAWLGYRYSPLKGAGLLYVFRRVLFARTVLGQEHTLGKQVF